MDGLEVDHHENGEAKLKKQNPSRNYNGAIVVRQKRHFYIMFINCG